MAHVQDEKGSKLADRVRANMDGSNHTDRSPPKKQQALETPLALSVALVTACHETVGGKVIPDAVLSSVESSFRTAKAAADSSLQTRRALLADESLPIAARLLRIKSVSERLCTVAARALDTATTKLESELRSIDQGTHHPALGAAGSANPLFSEIRSMLRADPNRSKILAQAIAADDLDTVAAALSVTPALSGFAPDELAMQRSAWQSRTHGPALARRRRLALALQHVGRAGASLIKMHQSLGDTPEARQAEQMQRMAQGAVLAADAIGGAV